jgi:1-aminocyclopropane-1-carboxylate deaminase/D-cysteine desulfhydrase-like pyridoxal-dependent ACC family enzyme
MKFADRNNNKILITTHSPLITDLINNYANLSYLNEAGIDVNNLVSNSDAHMVPIENIRHNDFGVYFFNGDSIKEYKLDDYGVYFKDYQEAANKVKDVSNILMDHIYTKLHPDA